ncbi:MAG TPA: EAL domain-containing protein [Methylophilus sp.]|nr:EAL domain-containing protein [Methylophilus sp.]HQQ33694.1 EAL domain-containing protein [Methylophilus sp.]
MNQPVIPTTIAHSAEIFLGRQPILDSKRQTIAYELLYRAKDDVSEAEVEDDLSATSAVIVNTVSQFGLERVIGKKDGFINVSASFLMSQTVELLPPERFVLEILEDVPVNAQILLRCKDLKDKGFRFALDGFCYRAEHDPILPLIDFFKIDLSSTPIEQVPSIIAFIRKVSKAKVIAEKVEEESVFLQCKELGCDAFQGFFFAKPTVLKGKKPQPHQMSLMRIMGMLLGDADLGELEPMFKNNPSLTIGLLRLVNSVGISGGRQKVESIRQAMVVLGQKQLLRWVQLLLYASPDGQVDNPLLLQVASRARLMELLAKKIDTYLPNFTDQAFMVGMLSLADVVMQCPLEEVFIEIGLSEDLQKAIVAHEGTFGELLNLAKVIELGDFDAAEKEIAKLGISSEELLNIQLETMSWSNDLGKSES